MTTHRAWDLQPSRCAARLQHRLDDLRTLLYPGRFYYSWMTGLIGSNDDAVAFINETHPERLDVSLIARALQCRHTAADPDALFPARTRLLSQIDACAALLAGSPNATRSI
jgi:hypothetical protein